MFFKMQQKKGKKAKQDKTLASYPYNRDRHISLCLFLQGVLQFNDFLMFFYVTFYLSVNHLWRFVFKYQHNESRNKFFL